MRLPFSILFAALVSFAPLGAFASPQTGSSGSVIDPDPIPHPHWSKFYTDFSGRSIPEIFDGNYVKPDQVRYFKARLEAMDRVRRRVLREEVRRLAPQDKEILSQQFNLKEWRKFRVTESHPNVISRASLYFEQDKPKLQNMDRVVLRLMGRARP